MAITKPTDQQLSDYLLAALNEKMLASAEPIIEKAVKEFECEMRAKLAANLISVLNSSYSFERVGTVLQISVSAPDGRRNDRP